MSGSSGPSLYDAWSRRLADGERLTPADIERLASDADILGVGMLADEIRRRAFDIRTTFVRVASCAFDQSIAEAVPPSAREVRLTGKPPSLDIAVTAVAAAKAVAGTRLVSGFSLLDIQALVDGRTMAAALEKLQRAGLERIAEVPIDLLTSPEDALESIASAGFTQVRLTVGKAGGGNRLAPVLSAAELAARFPIVQAINPLPMSLAAFRPTTGYEDAKAVALARLAAPPSTRVQVDWQRYGPKLAQVALTFGADDLDNVSASDEAPDGRRRAPLEEVRRNIEAAGFVAVERDGRFEAA